MLHITPPGFIYLFITTPSQVFIHYHLPPPYPPPPLLSHPSPQQSPHITRVNVISLSFFPPFLLNPSISSTQVHDLFVLQLEVCTF